MTTSSQGAGHVSPVFTWGDAPLHAANFWLQSMGLQRDAQTEALNEIEVLVDPEGNVLMARAGQPDLATMQMSFWFDEAVRLAQMSSAMLDTQLQWWKDLETGVAQWSVIPDARELHVMADSAGPVLVPPDDVSPASLVKAASGMWYAMTLAWMDAVQHDLTPH